MNILRSTLLVGILALTAAPIQAAEARLSFGGDQYAAGQSASVDSPAERDAFVAGYDVSLKAPVAGDAHLAGFNVTDTSSVTGDIYAAGFSVNLTGTVGGDVTAMGNSVTVKASAPVGGNARLTGATVTLSSPVTGAALVSAQTFTLNSTIGGDFSFFGENLTFGPDARVDGNVTIQAPKEIPVPATVASADRVKFQQLVSPDYASEAGRTAEHMVKGVWPAVWATGLWWLLLFAFGVGMIALLPRATARLQATAGSRPLRNLGLGILGFASVVGLVPVFALTLIGIFLLPFVFIFVAVACALAYVIGTYLLGVRIARTALTIDTNLKRFGVLAVSLVVAGLLGLIPLLGWLLSLVLVIFGFGALTRVLMARWTAGDAQLPSEPGTLAAPAAPEAV